MGKVKRSALQGFGRGLEKGKWVEKGNRVGVDVSIVDYGNNDEKR